MLDDRDVRFYRENGYLIRERVLDDAELAELRAVTESVIDRARSMTRSDQILDLDEGHTPESPRVRRIKYVVRAHPYYAQVLRHPKILGVLTALLGTAVRELGGKLNIKGARHGAPVEWHQDWAYYPHTNDDLLALGILLDDVGTDNAPLLVVPGSHRGSIYSHHDRGVFCGGIDVAAAGLDVSNAVALTAPAGSLTVHHVRIVHASERNRSNRPRRILFYECAAGDAWPIVAAPSLDEMRRSMIMGDLSLTPRMEALPVRIPLPEPPVDTPSEFGTLYEKQRFMTNPSFASATYRELPESAPCTVRAAAHCVKRD
jgi:ectoine hydroxylase-related dioxygenase (phytanoyl-CoA dioxygenase family)